MKGRTCFHCGKEHFGSCAAQDAVRQPKLTQPFVRLTPAVEPKSVRLTCERCVELERELAELRARLAETNPTGFDRKAYQREYMRRRRAKKG